jgi:23S rRNA pseudouridine2605 synthase
VDEFARDKRRRSRTVSVEAVTRSPRIEREPQGDSKEGFGAGDRPERAPRPDSSNRPARRSYNPNFTADNRFVGSGNPDRRPREDYRAPAERDFNRWDTPSTAPDRGERGYQRKPYGGNSYGTNSYGSPQRAPYGERKPYTPRPEGDRPYSAGPGKPYGPKKQFGPKKPFVKKNAGAGGMNPGAKPEFYPSYSTTDGGKELRLNRYIAMSGKCSRREADELIAKGEVTVNGNVVTEMGVKVQPKDEIRLKGELLSNERKVYIIINKPKGFVTSLDDPHAEKTVMDIVRNACTERIYPVGRLDKSSVGVLLLTNDGDLTEKLTHPSHNKKKVYQVTLERPLTSADLMRARDGIDLDDGVIIPDAVDFVKPDNRKEVGIEIHSGRNRIVRRIFEELGYGVHKLDRVYFAGLTKKNLKRGQWRFLTDKEVAMLKSGRYE